VWQSVVLICGRGSVVPWWPKRPRVLAAVESEWLVIECLNTQVGLHTAQRAGHLYNRKVFSLIPLVGSFICCNYWQRSQALFCECGFPATPLVAKGATVVVFPFSWEAWPTTEQSQKQALIANEQYTHQHQVLIQRLVSRSTGFQMRVYPNECTWAPVHCTTPFKTRARFAIFPP
jgi:hypothetical protein